MVPPPGSLLIPSKNCGFWKLYPLWTWPILPSSLPSGFVSGSFSPQGNPPKGIFPPLLSSWLRAQRQNQTDLGLNRSLDIYTSCLTLESLFPPLTFSFLIWIRIEATSSLTPAVHGVAKSQTQLSNWTTSSRLPQEPDERQFMLNN